MSKTRLLFMLLFVSSLSFAQLPTDQVAKYTFTNGSLVNIADAGNGDLSGGAVPTSLLRPDRFGNANNAIRIEASSRSGYAFTGTNNNISVSFWMAGTAGSNTRRVLQVYDGSGDGFHISTKSNTTMSVRFKNSGAVDLLAHQTSSPVFDGSWHHVVVTLSKTATGYDNNVYIDGVLNTNLSNINTTNTSDFLTSNANFVIAPGNTHYGNIDDIELFDRALTANEVQDIFNYTICQLNIPDANFKTYLVGNAAINTNGDAEIQCSEATAFTGTINVNNSNISDLTGIEAFTNLTELLCRQNNLTELDVSNNVALTGLAASQNTIASIDITNNTNLITFTCFNNGPLSNLVMSNGNNAALVNFDAINTPNLFCIQIDSGFTPPSTWQKDATASYSDNCNVYIPDANFKAALVANTNINTNGDTEIQISEASAYTGGIAVANLSIADLTGIEAFTEITALQAFGNPITSINVSQNTKITQLLIEQTSLSGILDLSMLTQLTDVKAHSTTLTAINMANGNNINVTRFEVVNSNVTCVQIDAGFSPNSNWDVPSFTSYSTSCAALSVDNFSLNTIAIYPNPSISELNIEMIQNLKQATIYSVLGAEVLKTDSKSINTTNLKSGMYIIKIEDENGLVSTKRFIKK